MAFETQPLDGFQRLTDRHPATTRPLIEKRDSIALKGHDGVVVCWADRRQEDEWRWLCSNDCGPVSTPGRPRITAWSWTLTGSECCLDASTTTSLRCSN